MPRISRSKQFHRGTYYTFALLDCIQTRVQNSLYFCLFKYARAVKQKVWNGAENREREWGETLKIRFFFSRLTSPYGHDLYLQKSLYALQTLTPRFTDLFTDFEEKIDCFEVYILTRTLLYRVISTDFILHRFIKSLYSLCKTVKLCSMDTRIFCPDEMFLYLL